MPPIKDRLERIKHRAIIRETVEAADGVVAAAAAVDRVAGILGAAGAAGPAVWTGGHGLIFVDRKSVEMCV